MTYLIVTAKHHDGFALWPSKVSAYNVVAATPFKRDILGELATACRKHGLKLGFYYSHWQDWANGGANPPWPAQAGDPAMPQPSQADYERYWYRFCLPQVKELLTNYRPDLLWFDSWHEPSPMLSGRRVDDLIKLIRTTAPSCLINGRINFMQQEQSTQIDFMSMNDNYIPGKTVTKPWESPGTMNESWGYNKNDFDWKPTSALLQNLVTCASRGGNYTLNVGPKADGTFPAPAAKRLRELGAWLGANRPAVWGTQRIDLPEPSWGRVLARPAAHGKTQLYAFVYGGQANQALALEGLSGQAQKVSVLETSQPVVFRQDQGRLVLTLPAQLPDDKMQVLQVELTGSSLLGSQPSK